MKYCQKKNPVIFKHPPLTERKKISNTKTVSELHILNFLERFSQLIELYKILKMVSLFIILELEFFRTSNDERKTRLILH